uniref:Ig-like domain-containing protein n=1 Tax=Xenopus tropicalis TaxID=8364 RepID=A0A6I8RN90_XENTR
MLCEGGGGGDVPLPVTGRVGETVTLPCPLNLTHPIDRVTWMFHVNGEKIFLAELRDQKFIRENENYFPNRLEGSNSGTALLIRELRMEDSGIFTAQILVNGEIRDNNYNLTVLGGGGGDVPLPVTGRVGETVTLTPRLTLTDPIDRVTWMFHVNGKRIILAEFRDRKFIRENGNYFPNRLEGSNSGTALLIRELRMEDSGIFTALILVNGEMRDISYNLTVLAAAGGGGGDVPLPVTGRVGETVTLPCPLNLTDPIDRVTWMFHVNGKRILLAEFRDQKFIRENGNYFPNRLEGSNSGTALLIRELRMEDSGIFTALFLVNGEMRDISYNVTVWESIPTPVIEKTLDGNSPDLCRLHCSVPSNSTTLSYSWTYRDTGTDRLYANGSTITVSLKDKALGAEFTCWVQNPAHRNSTST